MLSEEEKAINNMKLFARVHQDMTVVTAKEMDIVLNLIEKQQAQIEKWKDLANKNLKNEIIFREQNEPEDIFILQAEIEKKDNIIDKMAEYIAPLKNEKGVAWTRIGVKEYFIKLVEEENNE